MSPSWDNYSTRQLIEMLKTDQRPIETCSLICEITKRRECLEEAKDVLYKLETCMESFWNNILISDFAEAALDILEIKEYHGDREEVRDLIEIRLELE